MKIVCIYVCLHKLRKQHLKIYGSNTNSMYSTLISAVPKHMQEIQTTHTGHTIQTEKSLHKKKNRQSPRT